MFTAVSLQIAATAFLGAIVLLLSGQSAALSLLLGGAAAFIPNSLFAFRLALHQGRPAESYPVVFFLGEFAKIGLTIAILAAIIRGYSELDSMFMMIGLIVALKAPLFALWLTAEQATSRQTESSLQDQMPTIGKAI